MGSSSLKISEAASIGMHAASLMAANADRLMTSREIAGTLGVSQAHLAKVLQWLVQAGLVVSIRGPKGGVRLARDPGGITLFDVYGAIEGEPDFSDCLFDKKACAGGRCIFGDLLPDINARVGNYLATTKLAKVAAVYDRTKKKRRARS